MDTKIRDTWIEALRSGKYKQGNHHMRIEDSDDGSLTYCCLGVLTDALGDWEGYEDYLGKGHAIQCQETYAPAIAGLGWEEQVDFTIMNDKSLMSFEQIATYIEENY